MSAYAKRVSMSTDNFQIVFNTAIALKAELNVFVNPPNVINVIQQAKGFESKSNASADLGGRLNKLLTVVTSIEKTVKTIAAQSKQAIKQSSAKAPAQSSLKTLAQAALQSAVQAAVKTLVQAAVKSLIQPAAKSSPNQSPAQAAQQSKKAGIFSPLTSLAGSLLSTDNLEKLGKSTIGAAAEQSLLKNQFIARTGSEGIGSSMFDHYKAKAMDDNENASEYLNGALALLPSASNADQLDGFMNIAKNLSNFDKKNEGMTGAVEAVQKAMSGDTKDLAERFQIDGAAIKAANLEGYAKTGNADKFIEGFNKVLKDSNMGEDADIKLGESPLKRLDNLKNNLSNNLANAGQSAFAALEPIIKNLENAFKSGKFQPFFDAISSGLTAIATVASTVVSFLLENWGMVQNALIAVGIVLAALAAAWLIEWVMATMPLLLIIAAVFLLITILNQFGVSTSEIVAFVGGLFGVLVAFLYNKFAFFWNFLVAFAEFFANVLNDPAYALQKLFYDVVTNVLGYLSTMMEGIISGINWLTDKINKVSGTSFKPISTEDASQWLNVSKPETKANMKDFSQYRLDQKGYGEAFNMGESFAGKMMDKIKMPELSDEYKNFSKPSAFASKQENIDKINEVGKINETVDISSEDLKVMRDIAEVQSIQNFVTLTPTVQVTTGDIHQPTDVNEVIRRIEQSLEGQISNSAQGVYA